MGRTLLYRSLTILLALVSVTGCATQTAIRSARESFDRSKAAGAESKAPYEYFLAESYLQKAEHEAGEGDGDQARDYAARAGAASLEAIEKSKGGTR